MNKSNGLPGSLAAGGLRRPAWYANPFALDGFSNRQAALLFAVVACVATIFGLVTVAIGEIFDTRPIFYLSPLLVVIFAFAAYLDPRLLLVTLVVTRAIFDPVFQGATLPGIGGLGGLLNVVVIGLALALRASKYGGETMKISWLPWVPFIVVIAIGVVRSPDSILALRNLLTWTTYAAVFYGAFHCARNLEALDRLLRWLLLSSIPVFVYAVFSLVYFGPVFTLEAGEGTSPRLTAPLSHPNILAFYTVVMLGAWLVKVKSDPSKPGLRLRNVGWSLHLLMLLCMLAGTQTRSAWFGALLLFLVFGALVKRTYVVVIVVAAILALFVPEIRDRVLELGSNNEVYTYSKLNSYAWRQYLWASALGAMSPLDYLIGRGQGAFWAGSINFFPLAGGLNWNAHNVFVQLLFDTGIVGVLSYLSVFGAALYGVWSTRGLTKEIRFAAASLIGCMVFMSYSDNMLDYLVSNWNFWFLLGLVVAAGSAKSVDRLKP